MNKYIKFTFSIVMLLSLWLSPLGDLRRFSTQSQETATSEAPQADIIEAESNGVYSVGTIQIPSDPDEAFSAILKMPSAVLEIQNAAAKPLGYYQEPWDVPGGQRQGGAGTSLYLPYAGRLRVVAQGSTGPASGFGAVLALANTSSQVLTTIDINNGSKRLNLTVTAGMTLRVFECDRGWDRLPANGAVMDSTWWGEYCMDNTGADGPGYGFVPPRQWLAGGGGYINWGDWDCSGVNSQAQYASQSLQVNQWYNTYANRMWRSQQCWADWLGLYPDGSGTLNEDDNSGNHRYGRDYNDLLMTYTYLEKIGSHDTRPDPWNPNPQPAGECLASGWASWEHLDDDVAVHFWIDGVYWSYIWANQYRPDVPTAFGNDGTCASGYCGWTLDLTGLLTKNVDHTILAQVYQDSGGRYTTLGGSPKVINCYEQVATPTFTPTATRTNTPTSTNTPLPPVLNAYVRNRDNVYVGGNAIYWTVGTTTYVDVLKNGNFYAHTDPPLRPSTYGYNVDTDAWSANTGAAIIPPAGWSVIGVTPPPGLTTWRTTYNGANRMTRVLIPYASWISTPGTKTIIFVVGTNTPSPTPTMTFTPTVTRTPTMTPTPITPPNIEIDPINGVFFMNARDIDSTLNIPLVSGRVTDMRVSPGYGDGVNIEIIAPTGQVYYDYIGVTLQVQPGNLGTFALNQAMRDNKEPNATDGNKISRCPNIRTLDCFGTSLGRPGQLRAGGVDPSNAVGQWTANVTYIWGPNATDRITRTVTWNVISNVVGEQ